MRNLGTQFAGVHPLVDTLTEISLSTRERAVPLLVTEGTPRCVCGSRKHASERLPADTRFVCQGTTLDLHV
jgi:hypothetical protein